MDNKGRNNSDRDKMLEDILNNVGGMGKREPSRRETSYSKSRDGHSSNIERPKQMAEPEKTQHIKKPGYSEQEITISYRNPEYIDSGETENTRFYSIDEATEHDKDADNLRRKKSDTAVMKRSASHKMDDFEDEDEVLTYKKKKKRSKLPVVLILTFVIFAIAICLSVVIIVVGRDMLAIGKPQTSKIITIPENATTEDIAEILCDEGVISIPKAFQFVSKLSGADSKYVAGEHQVNTSDAYETLITKLTTDAINDKDSVEVTFVEGISVYDAAVQLEEEGVCGAEEFIEAFNTSTFDFDFESKLSEPSSLKFCKMEGYLFPDTYIFYEGMEPELVCQKIYKNFNDKITEDYYSRMEEMGMSLDEVITLASIVQAEAPTADSMKKVASVFLNRLDNPEKYPKLESDPTKKYVKRIIRPNVEIYSTEMSEAYNTYESNGLPPGAIGNPGIDAIEAVLYPADTSNYYFCANVDTKKIYYAETYEDHDENLNKIKKEQKEAKEKKESEGE